jgi:hypothetical protein
VGGERIVSASFTCIRGSSSALLKSPPSTFEYSECVVGVQCMVSTV